MKNLMEDTLDKFSKEGLNELDNGEPGKTYKVKYKEVTSLMKKVSKLLADHQKAFKKDGETDWTFTQNLSSIFKHLKEIKGHLV